MAAKGSKVLLLTDRESPPEHENLVCLRVKHFGDECLFPLAMAQVQGYLLHHVAGLRGYEAGVFRIASKVTTVE